MLVAGEYGKALRINAGENLEGYSSITLAVFHPRTNQPINIINTDITVGAVDVGARVYRPDGSYKTETFLANQYIIYQTKEGEFADHGNYPAKLTVDFPNRRMKSLDTFIYVAK
jgi:hypothetical protein